MSRMELEINPLLNEEHRQVLDIAREVCEDRSTEFLLQYCADSLEENFELNVGDAHELVMAYMYELSQK